MEKQLHLLLRHLWIDGFLRWGTCKKKWNKNRTPCVTYRYKIGSKLNTWPRHPPTFSWLRRQRNPKDGPRNGWKTYFQRKNAPSAGNRNQLAPHIRSLQLLALGVIKNETIFFGNPKKAKQNKKSPWLGNMAPNWNPLRFVSVGPRFITESSSSINSRNWIAACEIFFFWALWIFLSAAIGPRPTLPNTSDFGSCGHFLLSDLLKDIYLLHLNGSTCWRSTRTVNRWNKRRALMEKVRRFRAKALATFERQKTKQNQTKEQRNYTVRPSAVYSNTFVVSIQLHGGSSNETRQKSFRWQQKKKSKKTLGNALSLGRNGQLPIDWGVPRKKASKPSKTR